MILRSFGFRVLFHILVYITFSFFAVPNAHAFIIPFKQQAQHQLISDISTATIDTHESPPTTTPPPIQEPKLLKRQNGAQTCGFFSGDINYPYSCASDQRCVTDSALSSVFCCATSKALSDCNPGTTCIHSAVYASLTRNGYVIGQNTAVCTKAGYPYCNKLTYAGTAAPAGYSATWCGATSYATGNPHWAYATATGGGGGGAPTPSPTPTPSVSRSSTSSSTSSESPTSTNEALQEKKKSDEKEGLSTADKIALAVGIPCGLVAVGSIIGWLYKCCRSS
ncbi:hypothetical protein QBC43DRAFT_304433 [Cladorrhinum sp. PSN259]|nr:hypothetical protein QBC43DRAFT_304433 [Cladorrhinum sp. PSN259]